MKQGTMEKIQNLAVSLQLVTFEDMRKHSLPQLVTMIANKLNELMNEVHRFESDVIEMVETQNENIQYLLGEGLHLEVATVFENWMEDGTFNTLINQTALKNVNDRIDETNAHLSDVVSSVINVLAPPIPYVAWSSESDVTNIFDSMLADGRTIFIPSGVFTVSTSLNTQNCMMVYGDGTINYTGTDAFLTVDKNGFKMQGLKLVGTKASNQKAIHITNKFNLVFNTLEITGFVNGVYGTQSVGRWNTGVMTNCKIWGNTVGINCDTRFEYFNINNSIITGNEIGVRIVGGNIEISANTITDNTVGIHILNGDNGGHGIISANQINHNNSHSIKFDATPHGYTVTGNNIFYGTLELTNIQDGSIVLSGNTLGCDIKLINSKVVANGNFINQSATITVDELSNIQATGNLSDDRTTNFNPARYNTNESMLALESSTHGILNNYLTPDNTFIGFDTFNFYLGGFGQLVMSDNGYYDRNTGIFDCSKTANSVITVDCHIRVGLTKAYTQEPPIFYIRVEGASYQTNYELNTSAFDVIDGVRYCYYSCSKKILTQRNLPFRIVVELPHGADAKNVLFRGESYINIFGI